MNPLTEAALLVVAVIVGVIVVKLVSDHLASRARIRRRLGAA